ncbi:hypothetical protein ACSQ67_015974 [Phaseolus vulgaris]
MEHVATVVGDTSIGHRRGVYRRRSVHSPAVKKKKVKVADMAISTPRVSDVASVVWTMQFDNHTQCAPKGFSTERRVERMIASTLNL